MKKNDITQEELLANSLKKSFTSTDEDKNLDMVKLNDGHILEALDRTHVSIEFINLSLADHPLIYATPELSKKVEKISHQLVGLYQCISKINKIEDLDL